MDLGRGFSTMGGGCDCGGVGAAVGAGVLSGGVEVLFLLAGSERDALAGNFLFLSMICFLIFSRNLEMPSSKYLKC